VVRCRGLRSPPGLAGGVELGTELWYWSHELGIAKATTWHLELPRQDPTFRELPFSEKTRQLLRYDEGYNGTWQEGADLRWQAIFLRWNPGRIAVHLATSHTPEVCLTAAGRELLSQSQLRAVPVHGLQLPFRSYVVRGEKGPVHVFYCLWEDRADAQSFRTTKMSYANRLAPVLAGRRTQASVRSRLPSRASVTRPRQRPPSRASWRRSSRWTGDRSPAWQARTGRPPIRI